MSARIPALDGLRGLSLFGILVVNFTFFFSSDGLMLGTGAGQFSGTVNELAIFAMHTIFDGKFILIFSFLFGWGLLTQMNRSRDFLPSYKRRLSGLLFIGLAHAAFLFVGDILVTYAVLGAALLRVRHWHIKKLVYLAFALIVISFLCHAGLGALIDAFPEADTTSRGSDVLVHQTGSFGDILAYRLVSLGLLYAATPILFMPQVFAFFCLGLAAARHVEKRGLEQLLQDMRKFVFWLAIPAIAINVAYGSSMVWQTPFAIQATGFSLRGLGPPLLAPIYMYGLTRLFTKFGNADWLKLAGGKGKLSLSTYIGESVLMSTLALSYGFGLFGKISPAHGFLVCIAVYMMLVVMGSIWSHFFRLGPCEWLLRSITDRKWVSITHPAGS